MIDWSRRNEQLEYMDTFSGTIKELKTVLRDITKANTILGGNAITVAGVFRLVESVSKKSYTILDMGCADGNMLRTIAIEARKRKYDVKLIGVDLSADALSLARDASKDFPEITYYEKDILGTDFSDFECDIVTSTLTMHHFKNDGILRFLHQFQRLARIGIVINDLHRNRWAYQLFKPFSIFFIRSRIAYEDGLLSITKGFTRKDLQLLSNQLPALEHEIAWKWAFRYVWIMRKSKTTL